MFYDVFLSLCKNADISPSVAVAEMGLTHNALYKWKTNKNIVPRSKTISKVADYFGVPTCLMMPIKNEDSEMRNDLFYAIDALDYDSKKTVMELLPRIKNNEDFALVSGKVWDMSTSKLSATDIAPHNVETSEPQNDTIRRSTEIA